MTREKDADIVRRDAEWMVRVDDRVLESLRDYGNLTPAAIEALGVTTSNHASRRCAELARYGLLNLVVPGLYTLSDKGRAYLDEELDASTLERHDEPIVAPAFRDG